MPLDSPQRSYEPDKWTARHALVCDLALIGKTNDEIAKQLNYTPARVSVILGDERSQKYIREARQRISESMPDIMARLEFEANQSLNVALEVRDDVNARPDIRLKAAFGLLDRAGYSPIQQISLKKPPELSDEVADRIEKVARESREITATFRIPESPEAEKNGEAKGSDSSG